jgi:SPW repeat
MGQQLRKKKGGSNVDDQRQIGRPVEWNAHIVGIVIAVAALAALVAFQKWEEWANAALGAWLIVSPLIMGFSALAVPLWNQLIVGALVLGLAAWSALTDTHGKPIKT